MVLSILIVDNNDSFTFNLVEVLRQTNKCEVCVCKLEQISEVNHEHFHGIILSPGPGLPRQKNGLFDFIKQVESNIPLLGVCLGHQAIAEYFGAEIVRLEKILHGESSEVHVVQNHALFHNLNKQLLVGRYHSWVVNKKNLPGCFNIISETKNGTIMGLALKNKNICTVQFHPESILTPHGKEIIENWLVYCVSENNSN